MNHTSMNLSILWQISSHEGRSCPKFALCRQVLTLSPFRVYPARHPKLTVSLYAYSSLSGVIVTKPGNWGFGHFVAWLKENSRFLSNKFPIYVVLSYISNTLKLFFFGIFCLFLDIKNKCSYYKICLYWIPILNIVSKWVSECCLVFELS